MTENERMEQRRHWAREVNLLKAIIGGMIFLIVTSAGAGWWASEKLGGIDASIEAQDTRLDTLEDRYIRHRERMAAIEAVQQSDRQSIARIEERLASQGESIGRIEASVAELVRFLRNTP